ncbi:MAG: 5-(carboxyamino)imidazole ribonucleotide synthase [Rhodobacteraceae bacterium]|nr:MAG: 5-(carboxyamino)imidazole ribonucleotide synthase [Paracoccaceae bacterium]
MSEALAAGSVIGILGGGQLGRMLSVAAARLGYRCHIFDPADHIPASDVASAITNAAWDDHGALKRFAHLVDLVTYEFENVPTATLDLIEPICPIRPGRKALAVSQDRLAEKTFLRDLGLQTAPFVAVDSAEALAQGLAALGAPAILKTRRMGYDGKGQVRLESIADCAAAWDAMRGAPAILEGFVPFSHEVSVIAARGLGGEVACYDPGENLHKSGILAETRVPARLTSGQRTDAVLMAARILNALDYVGVLGVEIFVTEGALVVNEIAPRVHNSGHWTQNGCAVDQFEQHIRAITGLPLGDGQRHSDVVMENLIGDDLDRLPELLRAPHTAVHLYGKPQIRAGRKMGHINRITPAR